MIQIKAPDEILYYAAFHFAEQMGVEILEGNIVIAGGLSDNLNGSCIDLGHEIQVGINRDISDPFELFETLAHEMVHVAQILKGYLVDGPADIVYWRGRPYHDPIAGSKYYYQVPWEKEAYKKQSGLVVNLFSDEKFILALTEYAAKKGTK